MVWVEPRQIWAIQSTATVVASTTCTPFVLPSGGTLEINNSYTITLAKNAAFTPSCTGDAENAFQSSEGNPSSVADMKDPFYASTSPQIYAIATATIVAYLLVVILFITPRTFYVGGPSGASGLLGRRAITYGNSSVVGVGRRPWLQKVAALTVAISLTIASADTFKVAKRQYELGYMDADSLTEDVVGGTEIRVIRIISGTFLWLAQVQTLIRLFPRHKEKVFIKWSGFALIVLDTIFAILNNFVHTSSRTTPRLYVDAIPALAYLFELTLSLFYCASVVYYSLSKRRFAYFHPKMKNICLVALLSLSAVLVPVVFFVLDISKPDVAGWGDYIRWVGAAAASVVVWEWVERIEVLERDERKDGILGREVFDGDEMLEVTPSEEVDWPRQNRGGPGNQGGGGQIHGSSGWGARVGPTIRSRVGFHSRLHTRKRQSPLREGISASGVDTSGPTPPPAAVTPISRTDTASAASTVYAVRYHTIASPSPPVPELSRLNEDPGSEVHQDLSPVETNSELSELAEKEVEVIENQNTTTSPRRYEAPSRWVSLSNPFKRQRSSPPQEVATAQAKNSNPSPDHTSKKEQNGKWDIKSTVGQFMSSQRDWVKTHVEGKFSETVGLPVTVIPAQRRCQLQGRWTPQNEDTLIDESEHGDHDGEAAAERPLPVTVVPAPPRRNRSAGSPTDTVNAPDANGNITPQPTISPLGNRQVISRRGHLTIAEDHGRIGSTSPRQPDRSVNDTSGSQTSTPTQARIQRSSLSTSSPSPKAQNSVSHPGPIEGDSGAGTD